MTERQRQMDRDSLIARLNAETREERLDALSEIKRLTDMKSEAKRS